jgi:hypothetical protein
MDPGAAGEEYVQNRRDLQSCQDAGKVGLGSYNHGGHRGIS